MRAWPAFQVAQECKVSGFAPLNFLLIKVIKVSRLEEVNKTRKALGLPEKTELEFLDDDGNPIKHKGGGKHVHTAR